MPRALHAAIEVARAALYADASHALNPTELDPIYAALSLDGEEVGHRACAWIAILVARNALFRASFGVQPTWKALPEREIELATAIATGRLKSEASDVRAHLNAGFMALVAPWLADPAFAAAYTLKLNAAFRTAHLALSEVVRHALALEEGAEYHTRPPDASRAFGASSSSEDLSVTDTSDPSILASVATSWDERVGACNATELLRFWENWLIETVPGAWDAAHRALESDRSCVVTAGHQLNFYFEWGADSCLWATTEVTMDAFGNPADPERLPLSPATVAQIRHMCDWYQHALNWDYPPDPSPWRQDECERFNHESANLLEAIRRGLGEGFEVVGEPEVLREDPRIAEYLRDPKAYHHKRGISN